MQTYGVVFGRVLVGLQDLDPVPLAKPLDLPHRQVSKFLFKGRKKRKKRQNNKHILMRKKTLLHLAAFSLKENLDL